MPLLRFERRTYCLQGSYATSCVTKALVGTMRVELVTIWVSSNIIRTGRIELPLSPYQRDFLPLKDVREPVEVVETSSTAWRAVVIAVTLYGLMLVFLESSPLPDLNRSLPA